MDRLPVPVQHSLLVKNWPKFEKLLHITKFSFESAESEWQFALPKDDLLQYRALAPGLEFVKLEEIWNLFPFEDQAKSTLISLNKSCSKPILQNRTVFMLMTLIVIFDDPQNPLVTSIKKQYWTMLRRTLIESQLCDQVGLESCVENLRFCINLEIPLLLELKQLVEQQ